MNSSRINPSMKEFWNQAYQNHVTLPFQAIATAASATKLKLQHCHPDG
jgi:hypothetical protein